MPKIGKAGLPTDAVYTTALAAKEDTANKNAANGYQGLNAGGQVSATVRTATTTPVTVTNADELIVCNRSTTGAVTVNLPASPGTGDTYIIKDGKGDAGVNNVTVSGNGKNIDGTSTYLINASYGFVRVVYNGTQWNITNTANGAIPDRVLAVRSTTAQTLTAGSTADTLIFNSISDGLLNGYNTSTGVFTAPTDGVYNINAGASITSGSYTGGSVSTFDAYKNGVYYRQLDSIVTANPFQFSGSATLKLAAGDTLDIRALLPSSAFGSPSLAATATKSFLEIVKL